MPNLISKKEIQSLIEDDKNREKTIDEMMDNSVNSEEMEDGIDLSEKTITDVLFELKRKNRKVDQKSYIKIKKENLANPTLYIQYKLHIHLQH